MTDEMKLDFLEFEFSESYTSYTNIQPSKWFFVFYPVKSNPINWNKSTLLKLHSDFNWKFSTLFLNPHIFIYLYLPYFLEPVKVYPHTFQSNRGIIINAK